MSIRRLVGSALAAGTMLTAPMAKAKTLPVHFKPVKYDITLMGAEHVKGPYLPIATTHLTTKGTVLPEGQRYITVGTNTFVETFAGSSVSTQKVARVDNLINDLRFDRFELNSPILDFSAVAKDISGETYKSDACTRPMFDKACSFFRLVAKEAKPENATK